MIYIYIRIYHGIYHNIFSSFISHCILVTSNPPGAALFSLPLHRLERSCYLQSISLYASAQLDPARLPPPIAPHPVVELIEPASVAYPHAGICSSSSPVSKAVGQGGMCVAADIARHKWHTSQHIFCSADVQAGQVDAAGRVELLKNIGTPLHCMT